MKLVTITVNAQNILTQTRRWLLAGVIIALTASPSHGDSQTGPFGFEAVAVTAKPGTTGTFVGGGGTIGWGFTVNALYGLTVIGLGYYDLNSDGFGESHPVGIWDEDGELLGSATVSTTDPLRNGFRYIDDDRGNFTISLQYGQTYVIGAYHTEKVDNYLSNHGSQPLVSYSTAPEITYAGSRISFGPKFVEPTVYPNPIGNVVGRFGPNFVYVENIPEPGTALLLSLGLAGFGATARLRTRATA